MYFTFYCPGILTVSKVLSTIIVVVVVVVPDKWNSIGYTVQPKNNARATSGARSSCAARTRKRQKEVKLRFIRKKFKAQEVQNPTRKKPQEVENVNANRK